MAATIEHAAAPTPATEEVQATSTTWLSTRSLSMRARCAARGRADARASSTAPGAARSGQGLAASRPPQAFRALPASALSGSLQPSRRQTEVSTGCAAVQTITTRGTQGVDCPLIPKTAKLEECRSQCRATAGCAGIEFKPGHCEVWTWSGGIGYTAKSAGYACLHYGGGAAARPTATATTTALSSNPAFEPVGGGVDRACRGAGPRDGGEGGRGLHARRKRGLD